MPGEGDQRLRAIDPARSACVLIGVHDYTDLHKLPGVARNLEALQEVLTDRCVWGLPRDRLRVVTNPRTSREITRNVEEMAQRAQDALIVYYSGHGLIDPDENELYLGLPDSEKGVADTSARFRSVRRAMRDCDAACRAVILDCCYSGRALDEMGEGGLDLTLGTEPAEGAYYMTSTARDRRGLAAGRDRCTVFTGALVDVLREGLPDGRDMLSLSDCFDAVRARVRAADGPEPQQQDGNGVGRRPFVRNAARGGPPAAPPEDPHRRAVRRALVAGAVAVAFAAGAGVPPGTHWLRDHVFTTPPGGACSPDATLLSVSDALNGASPDDEPDDGLSALALTGPDTAVGLTDNEPGYLFPITLRGAGAPADSLAPRITTPVTLRHTGHQQFDGEGLVLEKGGRTVLISSEIGPVIRRFSLTTGREVGDPLPVPKSFRTVADGGQAQNGRTLESLALSPDGRYLYAGMEGPLGTDGDARGQYRLRIQRYHGTPGGTYTPDRQYAFAADAGLYLSELAVSGTDQLLALERNYIQGAGNAVHVAVLSLSTSTAQDVSRVTSLYKQPADILVGNDPLFDLAHCPAGSPGKVTARQTQSNPLLDNVEGMALGPVATTGPHRGWRTLYLVSDNNQSEQQVTRLYEFRVRVPAT